MNVPLALAISPPDPGPREHLVAWSGALARAGVPAIVIRLHGRTDRQLLDVMKRVGDEVGRASGPGTEVVVHSRADLAIAAGLRAVHLPSRGLPVAAVRKLLGEGSLVGRSTHSVSDVEAAEREGADYVVLGPIFDTPSKRRYGPPLGIDTLRAATRGVQIPVLAIGGVDARKLAALAQAGARGIAAIRLFDDLERVPAMLGEMRAHFNEDTDEDAGR